MKKKLPDRMKNPFSSEIYKGKYLSHFVKDGRTYTFDFIDGIEFFKHSLYPLYINIGRNLTKGITYKTKSTTTSKSFGNRTCLIYDVPDHLDSKVEQWPKGVRCRKVEQYLGYYIDLHPYQSIDEYLKANFSKPSRYKMRKYRRRLENCFDIRYVTYLGEIEKPLYDELFKTFRLLLKKRYTEKQIRNNNLEPHEWSFYKDVTYEMIRNKQASLFVVYDNESPISISLNYFFKDSIISAITVFDTDYGKFHVGSVAIWRQLEWCMENEIRIFDFSKGHYGYKEDWATGKYAFRHHIIYNKRSFSSVLVARYLMIYYSLKQYFRRKNLNKVYNKVLFQLKSKYFKYQQYEDGGRASEEPWERYSKKDLVKVDHYDEPFQFLKKPLHSFLYLNQEHVKDVDVLFSPEENVYCFKGKGNEQCFRFQDRS